MHIAVFTKNLTNPAYLAARLGADRAAAQFGATTKHYVPSIPDDIEEQIHLIDEMLAGPLPDAVVMSPVHSTAIDEALGRIHARGLPIVGLVTPIEAVPVVSFVNSDDFALAYAIAKRLFEHLQGRGDVLMVTGHVGSYTSMERVKGFEAAQQEFPEIRFVDRIAGDYVKNIAFERSAVWLQQHPDQNVDACLVANDIMAVGVIEALQQFQRKVPVVGVNAIPEAITAIQAGQLLATADFNAMRMAYLAAEAAARHLQGESVPVRIELPVEIVDRHNCHMWDMPYEQRSVLTLSQWQSQVLAQA